MSSMTLRSSLADEYVAAVKANDIDTVDKLFEKLRSQGKTVSKRKVITAYKSVKGHRGALLRRLITPARHSAIFAKSGGKTRRGRGSRRTRRA